jgi:hypothetical protein
MDNKQLRRIFISVTLILGNSIFMALIGPRRLFDNTYNTINNDFGYFLGDLIIKVGEGSYIIISYAIIIFVICKLFPNPKISGDAKE